MPIQDATSTNVCAEMGQAGEKQAVPCPFDSIYHVHKLPVLASTHK